MDEMFGMICGLNKTKERLTVVIDKGMIADAIMPGLTTTPGFILSPPIQHILPRTWPQHRWSALNLPIQLRIADILRKATRMRPARLPDQR